MKKNFDACYFSEIEWTIYKLWQIIRITAKKKLYIYFFPMVSILHFKRKKNEWMEKNEWMNEWLNERKNERKEMNFSIEKKRNGCAHFIVHVFTQYMIVFSFHHFIWLKPVCSTLVHENTKFSGWKEALTTVRKGNSNRMGWR